MIILIDGRAFTAPTAGISNFFKESVDAWARQRPQDTFFIALPRPTHKTFSDKGLPGNIIIKEKSNWLFHKLPNLVWLFIMMPILVRQKKADIYYSPVPCLPFFLPRRVKKIIVVHDVVNLESKETMQWTNRLANKLFFSNSIRKSDIIWTNSNYTKLKVEKYFPKRKCKEIFVGGAVDKTLFFEKNLSAEEKQKIKNKYGINNKFILFVGSLEPRKNLQFLLQMMPKLYKAHNIQLVVVGGKGWKNSSLKDITESPDFPKESTIFCGFITNEELALLYNTADCFVSAALMEGFGMPQLEALLCGCPVITAHNSAMIEVAEGKDGAYTVKGYEPQKWIDSILDVMENHPKVNQQQLAKYDWDVILAKFIMKL